MPERGRRHLLLAIVQRLHGPHRVAQLRGFLEALASRGVEHARVQRLDELVVLPFQKQLGELDGAGILAGAAHRLDARGHAPLDVVFEARAPALAGNHLVAGADAKQPVRERHRLASEVRRQKRAGVEAAVALHVARHEHARKGLVGRELQKWIVLVIAQQDVVLGGPLLDQVVLERERLDDRIGDDDLEPHDLVEQGVGLRIRAVRAQVVPHAVAQRPRFPDINRVSAHVKVQIHSRLLRQPRDLLLEFVDGHTLLWRVFRLCLNPQFYDTPSVATSGTSSSGRHLSGTRCRARKGDRGG